MNLPWLEIDVFKCFSSNVRSLVKNADSVSLALCQKNFDPAFIIETWLKAVNDLATMLGSVSYHYAAVRCYRSNRKVEGLFYCTKAHFP